MLYRVELKPSALRALSQLPKKAQRQVRDAIDGLAENPRPAGVKRLQGKQREYLRLRKGDYRIIYTIQDDLLLVVIVRVGARKDVYRPM